MFGIQSLMLVWFKDRPNAQMSVKTNFIIVYFLTKTSCYTSKQVMITKEVMNNDNASVFHSFLRTLNRVSYNIEYNVFRIESHDLKLDRFKNMWLSSSSCTAKNLLHHWNKYMLNCAYILHVGLQYITITCILTPLSCNHPTPYNCFSRFDFRVRLG